MIDLHDTPDLSGEFGRVVLISPGALVTLAEDLPER